MPIHPSAQQLAEHRTEFESLIPPPKPAELASLEAPWDTKDFLIFTRARPVFEKEYDAGHFCIVDACGPEATVFEPNFHFAGKAKLDAKKFKLDGSFGPSATNEEVYATIGKSFVDLPAGGGVSVMFAYGQTGTGKTYTVNHTTRLMVNDLYASLGPTQELHATFLEVLGANTRDLLTGAPVKVGETKFSTIALNGASEHHCATAAAFMQTSERALSYRRTVATLKNDTSSRSHAITKITVRETDPTKCAAGVTDGVMYLVDLAGSERAADRAAHGAEQLAEAKQINTSLMTLKDCIKNRAASGSAHRHVPYRQSPLTLILRDVFEFATTRPVRCVMCCCVSPLAADASHSINSLRYAQSMMTAPRTMTLTKDKHDPQGWSHERACSWLNVVSKGTLSAADLLPNPGDNGLTLSKLSEAEFIERATASGAIGMKKAKDYHTKLWTMVADARTRQRKAKMGARRPTERAEEFDKYFQQQMANHVAEQEQKL